MQNDSTDAANVAVNDFSLAGIDAETFFYTTDNIESAIQALNAVPPEEFYTISHVENETTIYQERRNDNGFPFVLYRVDTLTLTHFLRGRLSGTPFTGTFYKINGDTWACVMIAESEQAQAALSALYLPLFI